MSHRIVYPIVNINGTSKEALLDQYKNLLNALEAVKQALRESNPHGRDYQYNPAGEFMTARDQHVRWYTKLCEIEQDVHVVALGISDQD